MAAVWDLMAVLFFLQFFLSWLPLLPRGSVTIFFDAPRAHVIWPNPTVPACVDSAAADLSSAEMLCQTSKPFVWLLFRPPWSSDSCSKACIFKRLLELAEEPESDTRPPMAARGHRLHRGRLLFSAGKTMALTVRLGTDETRKE